MGSIFPNCPNPPNCCFSSLAVFPGGAGLPNPQPSSEPVFFQKLDMFFGPFSFPPFFPFTRQGAPTVFFFSGFSTPLLQTRPVFHLPPPNSDLNSGNKFGFSPLAKTPSIPLPALKKGYHRSSLEYWTRRPQYSTPPRPPFFGGGGRDGCENYALRFWGV